MGIIYGLVMMAVAYWFFNAAISVKKPAFKWAGISSAIFLASVLLGLLVVKQLEDSTRSSNIEKMMEKGYVPSADSARKAARQQGKVRDVGVMVIVTYMLPLALALLIVTWVRAKVLLGVGLKESLMKSDSVDKLADINKKDLE